MQMSPEALKELTAKFEGYRSVAYRPTPTDKWTIGYGHTQGVQEGDTCTEDMALNWLSEDIGYAENAVNALVTVPLTQYQFDALVDFVYNVGRGNFAASTLLRQLNQGIYDQKVNFMRWVYQNGTVLAGLETRRAAEAAWFDTKD